MKEDTKSTNSGNAAETPRANDTHSELGSTGWPHSVFAETTRRMTSAGKERLSQYYGGALLSLVSALFISLLLLSHCSLPDRLNDAEESPRSCAELLAQIEQHDEGVNGQIPRQPQGRKGEDQNIFLQLVVDLSGSAKDPADRRKISETIVNQLRPGDCLLRIAYADRPRIVTGSGNSSVLLMRADNVGEHRAAELVEEIEQEKVNRKTSDFSKLFGFLREKIDDFVCDDDGYRSRNMVTIIISDFIPDAQAGLSPKETLHELNGFTNELFYRSINESGGFEYIDVFNLTVGIEIAGNANEEERELQGAFLRALDTASGTKIFREEKKIDFGNLLRRLRNKYVISIRRDDSSLEGRVRGERPQLRIITESNYPLIDIPVFYTIDDQRCSGILKIEQGVHSHWIPWDEKACPGGFVNPDLEDVYVDFSGAAFEAEIHGQGIREAGLVFPLVSSNAKSLVRYEILDAPYIDYYYPGKDAEINIRMQNRTAGPVCVEQRRDHRNSGIVFDPFVVEHTGVGVSAHKIKWKAVANRPEVLLSIKPYLEGFNLDLIYCEEPEYSSIHSISKATCSRRTARPVERMAEIEGFDVHYLVPDARRWLIRQYIDSLTLGIDNPFIFGILIFIMFTICRLTLSKVAFPRSCDAILDDRQSLYLLLCFVILGVASSVTCVFYETWAPNMEFDIFSRGNRFLLLVVLVLSIISTLKLAMLRHHVNVAARRRLGNARMSAKGGKGSIGHDTQDFVARQDLVETLKSLPLDPIATVLMAVIEFFALPLLM